MKIVLFDIDETLLSCKPELHTRSSEKMFKDIFGINASEDIINPTGKTEKGIIEEVIRYAKGLNPDKEVEIPNKAYQAWAQNMAELLKNDPPAVLPGIKDLLQALSKDQNTLLGVLTGNSRLRAEVKLKASGLDAFFLNQEGVLIGVFGDIFSKRSQLVDDAKSKYGEGTYIIVDDSLVAARMAKENNIPAILVATGKVGVDQLKQYSEYVFKDFGDNRWQEAVRIINNLS